MTLQQISYDIVIAMKKQLHLQIRQIGNSPGAVIPKAILEQIGFNDQVGLVIEGDRLVLSKPKKIPVKVGLRIQEQLPGPAKTN